MGIYMKSGLYLIHLLSFLAVVAVFVRVLCQKCKRILLIA